MATKLQIDQLIPGGIRGDDHIHRRSNDNTCSRLRPVAAGRRALRLLRSGRQLLRQGHVGTEDRDQGDAAMTILPFMPREETLDGAYELIDRRSLESLGMHASLEDAVGWAEAHQIRRFEVWRDNEIILEC